MGSGRGLDRINQIGYRHSSVVRLFAAQDGYSDPGERAAMEAVAAEMRNKAILDIGVGGGRTIPLLTAISEDYTGIDFSEEMVWACRRKYPSVRVEVGDARDLAGFASGSMDLVVFSWNGIDHVNQDERMKVFREVHRVLRPGGAFLFSAHNKNGPGHGEKPWGSRRDLTQPKHMAKLALLFPVNLPNHLRYRKLDVDGDGWSIRNAAFKNFGMIFHYSTVRHQLDELLAAGFRPDPEVFESSEGRRLSPGEDTDSWWFHLIARVDGSGQAGG